MAPKLLKYSTPRPASVHCTHSTPSMGASGSTGTLRGLERVGELSPDPRSAPEASFCCSGATWVMARSGLVLGGLSLLPWGSDSALPTLICLL